MVILPTAQRRQRRPRRRSKACKTRTAYTGFFHGVQYGPSLYGGVFAERLGLDPMGLKWVGMTALTAGEVRMARCILALLLERAAALQRSGKFTTPNWIASAVAVSVVGIKKSAAVATISTGTNTSGHAGQSYNNANIHIAASFNYSGIAEFMGTLVHEGYHTAGTKLIHKAATKLESVGELTYFGQADYTINKGPLTFQLDDWMRALTTYLSKQVLATETCCPDKSGHSKRMLHTAFDVVLMECGMDTQKDCSKWGLESDGFVYNAKADPSLLGSKGQALFKAKSSQTKNK